MTIFRTSWDSSSDAPWQTLASGDRTGGLMVFGEARLAPRSSGPSLHVHTREDESVYVIDGLLTIALGDERIEASPGEFVWLPREVPHTFANLSADPVRVVGAIVPAGLEGMFAEQAAYFASLSGPPDETEIGAIGAKYGVTIVGPPLVAEGPA